MKLLLRLLFLLCISMSFYSCEEEEVNGDPDSGPILTDCKEISQTNSAGNTYQTIYGLFGIDEQLNYYNGTLVNYRTFIYDDQERIFESLFVDERENSPTYAANQITYDSNGKWVENKQVYSSLEYIQEATYDNQGQIIHYSYFTRYPETDTVNYTVAYEWVEGNNTKLVVSGPDYNYIITYQYDLERENKRRTEQEKTAFLSYLIAHNKNMRKSIETSYLTLSTGVINETNSQYIWKYDEAGYPLETEITFTNDLGESFVSNTTFEFSCD